MTGSASGDGSGLFWANITDNMAYFDFSGTGARNMGGRHFRGGAGKQPGFGGKAFDPWGFANISFSDGHVGAYSCEQIVRHNLDRRWYEFPFTPAAAHGSGFGRNKNGPQPGAEWWTAPHW